MNADQQEHLQTLRKTLYRRLCILEIKEAEQGPRTPAEQLIEMADIRDKIREIDRQLTGSQIGWVASSVDSTTNKKIR